MDSLFVVAVRTGWTLAIVWSGPGGEREISRLPLPTPDQSNFQVRDGSISVERLGPIDARWHSRRWRFGANFRGLGVSLSLVRAAPAGRSVSVDRAVFLDAPISPADDLDGDGLGEVVVAGNPWHLDLDGVHGEEPGQIRSSQSVLRPMTHWSYETPPARQCWAAGDLDGDQRPDLACVEAVDPVEARNPSRYARHAWKFGYFRFELERAFRGGARAELSCVAPPAVSALGDVSGDQADDLLVRCEPTAGRVHYESLSVAFGPTGSAWVRRPVARSFEPDDDQQTPTGRPDCTHDGIAGRRMETYALADPEGSGANELVVLELRPGCREEVMWQRTPAHGESSRPVYQRLGITTPVVVAQAEADGRVMALGAVDARSLVRGRVHSVNLGVGRAPRTRADADGGR